MRRLFQVVFILTLVFGLSMQASATLTTIGTANYGSSDYNLIYDDDSGLTWLDYSGGGEWQGAMDWAAGLNAAGVLTYSFNPGVSVGWAGDWRLPTALNPDGTGPCWGYCDGGELGHLYYTELGNVPDTYLANTGDFNNLDGTWWYWTSTWDAHRPDLAPGIDQAWVFHMTYGTQYIEDISGRAIAVRSSDVAFVPEPGTLLLLGGGLAGYGFVRRRLRGRMA